MRKKTYYIYVLPTILFLLFGCSTGEENKTQALANSDKEILRQLKEVDWPKAYADQDTILLDRILGDDFQMIDHSGNWYSKADEIDWIKKNATHNDSFRFEIKRFEIFDNGTATICGTGHIQKGSAKTIYQSSNVFIKREGEWKAILSHISGVENIEKQ